MSTYSKILHHLGTPKNPTFKSSIDKKRTFEQYEAEQKKTEVDKLQEKTQELQKNVQFLENYIINQHDEVYELKEQIKTQSVLEKHKLNEGLLNEPPNIKNSDPLTPLDQDFVTVKQLNDHYQLFINRIQQQMSTIGGGGAGSFSDLNDIKNFVFVGSSGDLPQPVDGVINLKDNYTYFFTTVVDLQGSRLIAGQNTTILGGSSESTKIKSTGIGTDVALLSSNYSIPIRNISFEAPWVLNLDATGIDNQSLDWFGVNFVNSEKVGIISSYNNFILLDSSFFNSQDLTFDGMIDTIAIDECLFRGDFDIGGNFAIIRVADSANISDRFQASSSSFIVPSTFNAIYANNPTLPDESFILDSCNFSGPGNYVDGEVSDPFGLKSFYSNNRGITNTFVNGQIYMIDNTTTTSIPSTNTWVKVAGTTIDTGEISKFIAGNNRLTCQASLQREYNVQCTISFRCEAPDNVKFGIYDSRYGNVRIPSQVKHTSSINELHHIKLTDLVSQFSSGNYIEIYCKNLDSTTSITVEYFNLLIYQIG